MRKVITFAAVAALCAAAFGQPQISIDPMSFAFSLYQYEMGSGTITIGNTGSDSLNFKIKECTEGERNVDILAWVRYADIDGEWENTARALDMYLMGYTLDTTYTEDPWVLEALLMGRSCFLIAEQENADDLFDLGVSWTGVLNNFLSQGGLILVLDHAGETPPLLEGAGLLNIDIIDYYTSTQAVLNIAPEHPFMAGMAPAFQVTNGWNCHTSWDGTPLATYNWDNHLTYKSDGAGTVVYWGVDFYEYTVDMAQLLCNIAGYLGELPWLAAHPMSGWLAPGGTVDIELDVDPMYLTPGDYVGNLAVMSNAAGSPDTVVVELTVLPPLPGEISVTPDSVNVELMMGSWRTDSLCVANAGPGVLNYCGSFNTMGDRARMVSMGRNGGFDFTPPQVRRQAAHPPSGGADEIYTGNNMSFGITDDYGEIMPFQFPVGNEHLYVGDYICGYTLSYLYPTGGEYLAYSVYEYRDNIRSVSYEELPGPPNIIKVRTVTCTENNELEYTQNFTFDISHSFIAVQTKITNISGAPVEDLYYKMSADWDVDNDYDDDNWGYDAEMGLPYAYESSYCSIYPGSPFPNIIDYDGWDDYDRRETDGNYPPGFYTSFDGLELLHYNCGDLPPGASFEASMVFAAGSSLGQLQAEAALGESYLFGQWMQLYHNIGKLEAGETDYMYCGLNAKNLIPGDYDGLISVGSSDPVTPLVEIPLNLTVFPCSLMVVAEPVNPPVQVSAAGDSFEYYLTVFNPYNQIMSTDIWSELSDSAGTVLGTMPVFTDYVLSPFGLLDTTMMAIAHWPVPAGEYTVTFHTGVYSASYSTGSSSFPIEVTAWDMIAGEGETAVLSTFGISGLYPNPFNQRLALEFTLPEAAEIKLAVYDVLGREIQVLGDGRWVMGKHSVVWEAEGVGSGVYFVRLMVDGERSMVRKVVLMK